MHGLPLRRTVATLAFVASLLLPGQWAWGQG